MWYKPLQAPALIHPFPTVLPSLFPLSPHPLTCCASISTKGLRGERWPAAVLHRKTFLNPTHNFCTTGPIHFSVNCLIMAHAPPILIYHLCILFRAISVHSFVPNDFGIGLIVPLVKDTRGSAIAEEPRDVLRQLKYCGRFLTKLLTRSSANPDEPCEHTVSWNRVKCCTNVRRIACENVCNRWMTYKVIQGHCRCHHLVGHILFPISLPL